MTKIVDFIITFIIVYFIIYLINRKKIDYKKVKSNDMINLIIKLCKLNIKKVKYSNLLKVINIVNSLIISISTFIIINIDNLFLSFVVGFLLIIILFFSLYGLVYLYYKKHNMLID